jgi:hypothetical protein
MGYYNRSPPGLDPNTQYTILSALILKILLFLNFKMRFGEFETRELWLHYQNFV